MHKDSLFIQELTEMISGVLTVKLLTIIKQRSTKFIQVVNQELNVTGI